MQQDLIFKIHVFKSNCNKFGDRLLAPNKVPPLSMISYATYNEIDVDGHKILTRCIRCISCMMNTCINISEQKLAYILKIVRRRCV